MCNSYYTSTTPYMSYISFTDAQDAQDEDDVFHNFEEL